MKKEDLAHLGINELKQEIVQLKKELFNLKLNASTMHLKDYSQFKKLRVKVARAFTHLRSHEVRQAEVAMKIHGKV